MFRNVMKMVLNSLKEVPLNGYVILLAVLLFSLNRFYLIGHSDGFVKYLLRNHFNDFLCGSFFTAYSNIFLNTKRIMLTRLSYILLLCFGAGLVWEFITPLFVKNSTSDWLDILCYMLGGTAYWTVMRLNISQNFVK